MADPVIPQRTAIRGRVPGTYDPDRRPGSSGQRYFSDIEYVTNVDSPAAQTAANLAAQGRRNEQAAGLQALNLSNLARQQRPATFLPPAEEAGIATVVPNQTTGVQRIYDLLAEYIQGTQLQPYGTGETQMMAQGGLASVAPKGMYLGGSTDGMADQIPATINNQQPAALSDGEFVIPADVVSHLGNGNSDAGAKQLYGMMDRIRKARTGSTEQGKQINPNKFLA